MPTKLAIPIDDEAIDQWRRRLEASRDLRKRRIEAWKDAIARVDGVPLDATPDRDVVVVNKEHPFVEMKKSQLLFQVPEVQLEPKLPGLEQQAFLFQAVVNQELGPDATDLKTTIDEIIPDTLVLGIGVSKIGYEPFVGTRTIEEPDLDPVTREPRLDPMTGQPVMRSRDVPVLLTEKYFWDWVEVDKFLLPADFKGLKFDHAPWLAFEFERDLHEAIRSYGLPKDFDAFKTAEDDPLNPEGKEPADRDDRITKKVKGVEIWYYARQFDPTEEHPDKLRLLVLIETGARSHPLAVRHQDSPYQRLHPETGELIGMEGHPIHPLVLRKRLYAAYPKSDVELAVHISEELCKGRTQMVRQRETSIPMRLADRTKLDPEVLEKVLQGIWQGVIPVDPNGQPLESIITEIARANFPRENFTFQEIADREYEDMWAMPRVSRGLTEDKTKTATEVQTASSAAEVRLDAERGMVLTWFTKGARKFAALLQLFKTDESFVSVVGPQGVQQLMAWNRDAIAGKYLFKVKPDSGLRIDAAARRKQMLDLYQMTANDPNVARVELLKTLFRSYNVDPARIVVEQLPAQKPDLPSLSFKGDDALNEAAMLLAQANGLQVPPQLLQMAQMAGMVRGMAAQGDADGTSQGPAPSPAHGGAAQQQAPLSKHAARGGESIPVGKQQQPAGAV